MRCTTSTVVQVLSRYTGIRTYCCTCTYEYRYGTRAEYGGATAAVSKHIIRQQTRIYCTCTAYMYRYTFVQYLYVRSSTCTICILEVSTDIYSAIVQCTRHYTSTRKFTRPVYCNCIYSILVPVCTGTSTAVLVLCLQTGTVLVQYLYIYCIHTVVHVLYKYRYLYC